MTLVDRCPHGSSRRSIICDYTNAQGAVNVAQSTCHSGWLCSSLTPTLRLANAAPVSASTHLRALWSSVCTCGASLPSATSSKLLMHRSTPKRILLFTVAMWFTTAPLSSALLREAVSSFHEGRPHLQPANSSRSARSSLRTRF